MAARGVTVGSSKGAFSLCESVASRRCLGVAEPSSFRRSFIVHAPRIRPRPSCSATPRYIAVRRDRGLRGFRRPELPIAISPASRLRRRRKKEAFASVSEGISKPPRKTAGGSKMLWSAWSGPACPGAAARRPVAAAELPERHKKKRVTLIESLRSRQDHTPEPCRIVPPGGPTNRPERFSLSSSFGTVGPPRIAYIHLFVSLSASRRSSFLCRAPCAAPDCPSLDGRGVVGSLRLSLFPSLPLLPPDHPVHSAPVRTHTSSDTLRPGAAKPAALCTRAPVQRPGCHRHHLRIHPHRCTTDLAAGLVSAPSDRSAGSGRVLVGVFEDLA